MSARGSNRAARACRRPAGAQPWPMRLAATAAAVLAAASLLPAVTGCAPAVVVAGVGATAVVATDRRTTGAQVDDEAIELKISTAAGSSYGNSIHVNVTSYNGTVLLSGEVPSTEVRNDIVNVAKTTPRVKSVDDYMVIGPVADLGDRTNDSYITSKVKARLVESDSVSAKDIKVVTERSTVYLMGIVSRDEGKAAAEVAATTSGVARVVKLFEYTN
jgi:osmotically-inducible protein OsmY